MVRNKPPVGVRATTNQPTHVGAPLEPINPTATTSVSYSNIAEEARNNLALTCKIIEKSNICHGYSEKNVKKYVHNQIFDESQLHDHVLLKHPSTSSLLEFKQFHRFYSSSTQDSSSLEVNISKMLAFNMNKLEGWCDNFTETTNTSKQSLFIGNQEFSRVIVKLNPVKAPLSKQFVSSIDDLMENKTTEMNFFKNWGNYVFSSVELGGRVFQSNIENTKDMGSVTTSNQRFKVDFTELIDPSASLEHVDQKNTDTRSNVYICKFEGGNNATEFSAWKKSIESTVDHLSVIKVLEVVNVKDVVKSYLDSQGKTYRFCAAKAQNTVSCGLRVYWIIKNKLMEYDVDTETEYERKDLSPFTDSYSRWRIKESGQDEIVIGNKSTVMVWNTKKRTIINNVSLSSCANHISFYDFHFLGKQEFAFCSKVGLLISDACGITKNVYSCLLREFMGIKTKIYPHWIRLDDTRCVFAVFNCLYIYDSSTSQFTLLNKYKANITSLTCVGGFFVVVHEKAVGWFEQTQPNSEICIWSVQDLICQRVLNNRNVHRVIGINEREVLLISDDGTGVLYDVQSEKRTKYENCHGPALKWQDEFIIAARDGSIRIFSETGACRETLQGHKNEITYLYIHENVLVSVSECVLRVWDPASASCIHINDIPKYQAMVQHSEE